MTHIVEIAVDGHTVIFRKAARIKPGMGRIQFRYAGIWLRAPDRVRYSYKLEGLDSRLDLRRRASNYRLQSSSRMEGIGSSCVRRSTEAAPTQSQFAFEVLPHFYETRTFLSLCAVLLAGLAYVLHQLRLTQIRSRFALVVEERVRLAREIHDTLAQGFVGISLQLDTVEGALDKDPEAARQYLNGAQKMARHSLTEARQSMADLRTTQLPEQRPVRHPHRRGTPLGCRNAGEGASERTAH